MDVEKKVEAFVNKSLVSMGKAEINNSTEPLLSVGKLDSLFVIDFILFLEDEFKLDFSKENVVGVDIDNLSDMISLVKRKLSEQ